ncbi:M48 family metalloprotease [Sphingomonas yantingensis]|uniref:Putative Zn-dependent protease n=1 Tax=Sphingomonas yantingensis TaxID=1241761 RepID=A0A7W9ASX1_9SPHN|nr:M48 family metalloprotease [Sphingomonas yantingensis]MBB5699977.1 putative Zn-dependent protease [Sphingomonas yantingensis]
MKRLYALFALLMLVAVQPARAQSILRDAETEALLNDASRPIIEAAGLSPRNVRIVLINDPSINAFVAGGQAVYIHSGLIDAADDINQVQGVIAHELGHVTGGHAPLSGQMFKQATGISILSLVLGVAAMAAGAGEAGAGILAAGQQAAMGTVLAFSRNQESSADAAGVRYLNTAKISGKGMLEFFKKLQNQEFRLAIPQNNPYHRTHPLSGQRIANLTNDLTNGPGWRVPTPAGWDDRFKRIQAKLRGYVDDPKDTLRKYPATDTTIPARYARAYAYHRSGYPEQAAAEAEALVRAAPQDPYFLELEGQILLESGKPAEALKALRTATERTNYQPLIATTFGHALVATEDPANLPEAEKVLRQAVGRDDQNPFAWYQLGTVYERKGDAPRTALAAAEQASLSGDNARALYSARAALAGLPQGSPDYIRAQDIQMTAEVAVEADKKNRRRQR